MDLQFRNLRIRNAVASDAPQLTRWWNDGSVMAHAGFPHGLGTTEEEVAGKLAQDREALDSRVGRRARRGDVLPNRGGE